MISRLRALLAVTAIAWLAAGGQPSAMPAAADRVPVIIELFTSEGCSSCPPADRLLADLVQQQPAPGSVIALGEHVDYWDQLGWVDPFSDAQFTRRQNEYANATGSSDVYTPQMIVDGREAFVGSDRTAALTAIKAAATRAKTMRIVMNVVTAGPVGVAIDVQGQPAMAEVWLAVTEDHLSSDVTRGENAGRTLHHAAVTRRLTRIGDLSATGTFSKTMPLDLMPTWRTNNLKIVAFVQERMSRRIIGAASVGLAPGASQPFPNQPE